MGENALKPSEIYVVFNMANEILMKLPKGQTLSIGEQELVKKLFGSCGEYDKEILEKQYPKVVRYCQ